MAWDFSDIAGYFRQYAGTSGLSGAAFLGEWSAADGFDLSNYPAVRENQDPEAALLDTRVELWAGYIGGAWESVKLTLDAAGYTQYGLFKPNVLISGVDPVIVIKGWGAKGIGFGYVLGIDTALAQIQVDQVQAILLVRGDIATDGTITQIITMNDPFTSQDLTEIAAWMSAHGVTNSEFATKMGWASPSEGQTWMLANSRRAFLQRVHDLWDS